MNSLLICRDTKKGVPVVQLSWATVLSQSVPIQIVDGDVAISKMPSIGKYRTRIVSI